MEKRCIMNWYKEYKTSQQNEQNKRRRFPPPSYIDEYLELLREQHSEDSEDPLEDFFSKSRGFHEVDNAIRDEKEEIWHIHQDLKKELDRQRYKWVFGLGRDGRHLRGEMIRKLKELDIRIEFMFDNGYSVPSLRDGIEEMQRLLAKL